MAPAKTDQDDLEKNIFNVLVVDNDDEYYAKIREYLTESRAARYLLKGEPLLFVERVTPDQLEAQMAYHLEHDLFILDPGIGPDGTPEAGGELVQRLMKAGYRAPVILLTQDTKVDLNGNTLSLINDRRVRFVLKQGLTAEELRGHVYDAISETISVLVVDDDPEEIELTTHMLGKEAKYAFQVTAAHTLDEALDAMRCDSFDVVLLDYRLGAMRGTEAIEKFNEAGFNVPVVLTSQHDDVSHDETALRLLGRRNMRFLSKQQFEQGQLARSLYLASNRPSRSLHMPGHA